MVALLAIAASPVHAALNPAADDQSDLDAAGDVAATPLSDINVMKDEIPDVLNRAVDNPYAVEGLRRCQEIIPAVIELNEVLGPDYDEIVIEDVADKRRATAKRVGSNIVGSLIPFRGIVREISGAASHERKWQEAIYAGIARRAFLKGMGQQRRCKVPGRPAEPPELSYSDTVTLSDRGLAS